MVRCRASDRITRHERRKINWLRVRDIATADFERFIFTWDAAVCLQHRYSLLAKFHTVFTFPATCYSYRQHPTPSIMVCLSCSTAFWVVLFATFIVLELGVTAILMHLSTRS